MLFAALACLLIGGGVFMHYRKKEAALEKERIEKIVVEVRERLDSRAMEQIFLREMKELECLETACAIISKDILRHIRHHPLHYWFGRNHCPKIIKRELVFLSVLKCFSLKQSSIQTLFEMWKQMLSIVVENSQSMAFEEKSRYGADYPLFPTLWRT